MGETAERCEHVWYLAETGGTIWWADGRREELPRELVTVCIDCGERRADQPSLA